MQFRSSRVRVGNAAAGTRQREWHRPHAMRHGACPHRCGEESGGQWSGPMPWCTRWFPKQAVPRYHPHGDTQGWGAHPSWLKLGGVGFGRNQGYKSHGHQSGCAQVWRKVKCNVVGAKGKSKLRRARILWKECISMVSNGPEASNNYASGRGKGRAKTILFL